MLRLELHSRKPSHTLTPRYIRRLNLLYGDVNVLLLKFVPHWLVGLAMRAAIHVEQDQKRPPLEALFDTPCRRHLFTSRELRTNRCNHAHIYINT